MPPKKRSALEALDANGGDLYGQYVEALEGAPIDMNADQVRRRIRTFLDSGAMSTGEFQNAIEVNSRGFNMFMTQSGASKGIGSNTFQNAWVYFKGRELSGLGMPKKPRVAAGREAKTKTKAPPGQAKKTAGQKEQEVGDADEDQDQDGDDGDDHAPAKPKSKSKSKAASATAAGPPDVSDMTLPDEPTDSTAVYDSCDEIRRKINAHLKLPGVTQASFLRVLAAQWHTRDIKIQSKQLADFRSKKGANSGNTSAVYRAAYVYFEKLRLKANKPKTKHRLEAEQTWRRGFDTDKMASRYVTCAPGDYFTEDHMGRMIRHRG